MTWNASATVELKSASTAHAVASHLRSTMLQSPRLVIDCSASTSTADEIVAVLDRALRAYGSHYVEILVLLAGGDPGLHWMRDAR